mgnify:CR=1 FL=1
MTLTEFLFKQKIKIILFSTKRVPMIFFEKLTVSEINASKRTRNFELLTWVSESTLRTFTNVRSDKLLNSLGKNAYFLFIQSSCERENLPLSSPTTWVAFWPFGRIGKTGQTFCSCAIFTSHAICSYFFSGTMICSGLSRKLIFE